MVSNIIYYYSSMNPKKALIYLSIIAALLIIGVDLYFFINNTGWIKLGGEDSNVIITNPQTDLDSIIEKKKDNQALSPEEEEILSEAIKERAVKRVNEIQKAAKGRSFTQEELDFIYDPSVKIKNDLGIK